MIERGDAVIVNDLDRPCTRHIAIVTQVEDDLFEAEYLAADCEGRLSLEEIVADATRIEWFGMRLRFFIVDNQRFAEARPDPDAAPVATYANGKAREWQPNTDEVTLVRDDVYALWAAGQKEDQR